MGLFARAPWNVLESWRPTTFLVAGSVLLGYAGLKGIELSTALVLPDVLKVTVGHFGLLIPVFALLGLYPQLQDVAPRLSLAGVVTSAVSGICSIVLLVTLAYLTLTMEGYPAVPGDTPLWGAIVLIVSLLTIKLGFLMFGVASLRSDVISRQISYLLLVPVVMWATLYPMLAVGIDGNVIGVLVYVPIASSLLAIGYRLRHTPIQANSSDPLTDPTI